MIVFFIVNDVILFIFVGTINSIFRRVIKLCLKNFALDKVKSIVNNRSKCVYKDINDIVPNIFDRIPVCNDDGNYAKL